MSSFASLPPLPSFPSSITAPSVLDHFRLAVAVRVQAAFGVDLPTAFLGVEAGKPVKGGVAADFSIAVPRFRIKGDTSAMISKFIDQFEKDDWLQGATANGSFISVTARTETLVRLVLEDINAQTYLRSALPTSSTTSIISPTPVAAGGLDLESLSLEGNPHPYVPSYGSNVEGQGKTIIVEFSSPNIAKPFHAGHLRSTIIGAFLANLYEKNGWKVTRMNYLGDWGKQFGILAVGFEKYGSEAELAEDAITHLYDVYVKINADGETDPTVHDRAREFFLGMENGDKKSLALWQKFRDLSIVKYRETYARLNVHFDYYSGESQVSHESQRNALDTLTQAGVVQESQGALIVDLEAYKLGKTVVRKKDGTFVYITRDIGGAFERWNKFGFDKMIYVVASQQDLHLAQFFKVLNLMGYEWANRLQHVSFGMVLGMSTRKGTAVFLEQILNESKHVMHEQMKKNEAKYNAVDDPEGTSDTLGITAVKIQDMAGKRVNNYKFEWARMTSFEGDTGPYLQYAHVRLSSVERKNAPLLVLPIPSLRASTINTKLLSESKAREIIFLLAQYPDVVKLALKTLEPSAIVTFCFKLTHCISSAWETIIVKGQEEELALARLWLYISARDVLASAMRLLTLEPLEKM